MSATNQTDLNYDRNTWILFGLSDRQDPKAKHLRNIYNKDILTICNDYMYGTAYLVKKDQWCKDNLESKVICKSLFKDRKLKPTDKTNFYFEMVGKNHG